MSRGQVNVGEEADFEVSKVSYVGDTSGYEADHETEASLVPDTADALASNLGDVERVTSKQRFGIALVNRLVNAHLEDVLRYALMIILLPSKFYITLVDAVKQNARSSLDFVKLNAKPFLRSAILHIVNNASFFPRGMDMLKKGLKIYEISIRKHMKYVRGIRKKLKLRSRKPIVKSTCPSECVDDEHSTSEPQPKQRRVESPESCESIVFKVYRWFTGPVTPEDYHFSTEETWQELLHKAELESYHSSQDPDYEPNTESDELFSSYSSAEACEVDEDNVNLYGEENIAATELESKDVVDTSVLEAQIPYY